MKSQKSLESHGTNQVGVSETPATAGSELARVVAQRLPHANAGAIGFSVGINEQEQRHLFVGNRHSEFVPLEPWVFEAAMGLLLAEARDIYALFEYVRHKWHPALSDIEIEAQAQASGKKFRELIGFAPDSFCFSFVAIGGSSTPFVKDAALSFECTDSTVWLGEQLLSAGPARMREIAAVLPPISWTDDCCQPEAAGKANAQELP